MSVSRQILLPLLAVSGLVAAACGADDSAADDAAVVTEAPAADSAPAGDDDPVTSEAPVDTEAPVATEATDSTSSNGLGSGSEFCNFVTEAQDTGELLDSITSDPAEVEQAMNELRDTVEELRRVIPDEASADVDVFADSILQLIDSLEAADYNFLDADLAFMQDPGLDERMTEVSERLDQYSDDQCGIRLGVSGDDSDEPDDEGDDDEFDAAGGTAREQMAAQFELIGFTAEEAECIAGKIDPTNANLLAGDEGEVLAIFDECNIPLSRIAELGG